MERRTFTRSQTDRTTCAIYGALAIASATLGGFLALYLALPSL